MRVTGSRVKLFLECQYIFRDDTEYEDISSESAKQKARFGSAMHALIAAAIDPAVKTMDVDDVADAHEVSRRSLEKAFRGWRASVDPVYLAGGWRAEVAYAYDPRTRTARELGQNIGRAYDAYGRRAGEIACSVDVVGWSKGILRIADWKTGMREGPASEAPQLLLGALCAGLVGMEPDGGHGGPIVIQVSLHYVNRTTGAVTTDTHTLKPEDIFAFEERLCEKALNPSPLPLPGPHCTSMWCPLRNECFPF